MLRRFCQIALLLLLPSTLSAAPLLSFEENTVVASGVTSGGRVAFLGVGREPVECGAVGWCASRPC
jgi:hypothetical protein